MEPFARILENNRRWVERMKAQDPAYFTKLASKQEPHFLFIGCSDSRVPATEVTGTAPGETFVHRNIANLVVPTDLNMLSVVQYAIDVLDVAHVIVCGHYGCGGIKAAMQGGSYGLVDHWLANIRNVMRWHADELADIGDDDARHRRIVELNVRHQVANLAGSPVVRSAWARGRRPVLHGLVYDLPEGLLRELFEPVEQPADAEALLPARPAPRVR